MEEMFGSPLNPPRGKLIMFFIYFKNRSVTQRGKVMEVEKQF
jgi:hypothetical protein